MRQKFLLTVLVVLGCFLNSYSQTEFYGRYTLGGGIAPVLSFSGITGLTDRLDLTGFGLVEDCYSRALIGLSYSFTHWMKLGLSTGIETTPAFFRQGGSCWFGSNNLSLLSLVELGRGKDNYWYKTSVDYQVNKSISLGVMAWRLHGIGPMIKYSFNRLGITLWTMPAYDFEFESKRLMVGIRVKQI